MGRKATVNTKESAVNDCRERKSIKRFESGFIHSIGVFSSAYNKNPLSAELCMGID
jgi:hypothetical protein